MEKATECTGLWVWFKSETDRKDKLNLYEIVDVDSKLHLFRLEPLRGGVPTWAGWSAVESYHGGEITFD